MKLRLVLASCLIFVLLAACQSTTATPASPPTNSPLPTNTPAPTATAKAEPVNVTAFCTIVGKDKTTHVAAGTPVRIIWGWSANTEAQIDDFLENNITTITLDGKVIEGTASGGIQKNEKSGLPEIVWHSDVDALGAGQHTITYDVKWKKMISDGISSYGPGSRNETEHDECLIVVE